MKLSDDFVIKLVRGAYLILIATVFHFCQNHGVDGNGKARVEEF